ncbi:5'-methylthioadenosine nucleosidase [Erysipelotrichaceae bacterium]|nr:5'-methylthioadenosine nucleosidase [Erysipelotrichaceae bacterium]
MRTAIIAAMDEEIHYLKSHIEKHECYEFQKYEYHIGEINGKKIVLAKSGIGKVNAALSTALLLEHFKVKEVINIGSAGAIDSSFTVGDIIIGEDALYHDVDVRAFGYEYGQVPAMPLKYVCSPDMVEQFKKISKKFEFRAITGTIATGDSFMNNRDAILDLYKLLPPPIVAVDMEAAAITQVCFQYDIPFIVVRSISDIVGKNSPISFKEYIDLAAKNSAKMILSYLHD